ncbi:MAG: hypothetical protein KF784_09235 [Fimbriimonadaceae bacterium]|nr:hypothetical protein [Fimbriimonadaceae bacterium]
MFVPILAVTLLTAFPEAPIPHELVRGVSVFKAGKGLDRVLMDDRKAFGQWFDGKIRRDVDEVLRLSPALMSRWLGYLAAEEKWTPSKVAARWDKIKAELEGNHWFVVRLSAFPKLDLLDGSPSDSANASTLDNVRFQITLNGRKLPMSQTLDPIFGYVPTHGRMPENYEKVRYVTTHIKNGPRVQTRHWKDIGGFSWVEPTALADILLPEFYEPKLVGGLPLGEYFATWYLVSTPVLQEKESSVESIELWVFQPKKQSMVSWDYEAK